MTMAQFAAISEQSDDLLYSYSQAFIFNNDLAANLPLDEIRAGSTKGLRFLLTASIFDAEVCNGGITQFFWNQSEDIDAVFDLLLELDQTELLDCYNRACFVIQEHFSEWALLRQSESDWESFRKTYDLLQLSWFDEAYYDKYDFDGPDGMKVVSTGLQAPFRKSIGQYVESHLNEFIRLVD